MTGRQLISLAVLLAGIHRAIVKLVLARTAAREAEAAAPEAPTVSAQLAARMAEVPPKRIAAVEEEIVSAIGKPREARGLEAQAPLEAVVAQAAPQLVRVALAVRQASEAVVLAVAVAVAVAGDAGECNELSNKGQNDEIENTEN